MHLAALLFLFVLVSFGLAWPLTSRLTLAPVEKLLANVLLSLTGTWLVAWAVYVTSAPVAALWILPIAAAIGLTWKRRDFLLTVRVFEVRSLLSTQTLLTGGCLCWLALVASYSGGGWSGDWLEHWERARFFVDRGPHDQLFIGVYPLTSRPPLVNVVVGAFLALTRVDFAFYQVATTLFASLVFLPAAALARRWAGERNATPATAVLAALLLANPLFIQNATFPWTKLQAAFFILTALYFFCRSRDRGSPLSCAVLFAVALAGGLVAHYSAGPYAVALGVAWLIWPEPKEKRTTGPAALVGALLLAAWFGWAVATYGMRGTFLTNTSVTDAAPTAGGQLTNVLLNVRDTLVPWFLRPFDRGLISQTSPWGLWRDYFFQAYQLNLLLAFGCVAWLVILQELFAARRAARAQPFPEAPANSLSAGFWTWFIGAVAVLAVVTHGARDHWGLTHISLQGFVLLGLAFLAARWSQLSRGWRTLIVIGGAIDFIAGVVLQFLVQNYALDRWLTPTRGPVEVIRSYNAQAAGNAYAMARRGLETFGEILAVSPALLLFLSVVILMLAVARVWIIRRASSHPPEPSGD